MAFKNIKFIKSAADESGWIDDDLKEIVLLGRSNVGKSTFINRISNNSSLAKVSSKPGKTKLLNFFDVDNMYRIVDAPGYGYAGVSYEVDSSFAKMMSEYLSNRENLVGAVLLLDSRRIPNKDDKDAFDILKENKIPFIIVATKCDKLNQSEKAKMKSNFSSILGDISKNTIICSSSVKNDWIDEIYKVFDDMR